MCNGRFKQGQSMCLSVLKPVVAQRGNEIYKYVQNGVKSKTFRPQGIYCRPSFYRRLCP